MKTKVFFDTYKGYKMFAIWEVDEQGNKVGDSPIISFGSRKAKALMSHFGDLKDYIEASESDAKAKGKR